MPFQIAAMHSSILAGTFDTYWSEVEEKCQPSLDPFLRLANCFGQIIQEQGCARPVGGAVVAG
jgi:hypothetical protein